VVVEGKKIRKIGFQRKIIFTTNKVWFSLIDFRFLKPKPNQVEFFYNFIIS